jgi:hypothetical protein
MSKTHRAHVAIPSDAAKKVQKAIGGKVKGLSRDSVYFERIELFDDGCCMAVQAVVDMQGTSCWMQGVLFSPNGGELGCTDPRGDLTGKYAVDVTRDDGVHRYVATVKSE